MEENKKFDNAEANRQVELSPEIKAALEKSNEIRKKFAEIFAQCWDDEDFKKKFMESPKAVMDEYGVEYDKSKDYVVSDSKPKTVTYVLPYENIKDALDAIGEAFKKSSAGSDTRKIIPEGWSMEFIQDSADTCNIVIPQNPEKLTPEELEMINGGFILGPLFVAAAAVLIFLAGVVQSVGAVTSVLAVAEVDIVTIGSSIVRPDDTSSSHGSAYKDANKKVY